MGNRKWERDDLIKRIAMQGGAKWIQLQAAWRSRRYRDVDRVIFDDPPAKFSKIFCWWCRTSHSPDEVEKCMALPRRNEAPASSGSSTSKLAHGQLLSQFSEVLAFLTQTTWPDGKRRTTGRLSLSCGLTSWTLSAVDEESGQYVSLAADTPDDALLMFEAGLADGTLPWRASKYSSKGAKR